MKPLFAAALVLGAGVAAVLTTSTASAQLDPGTMHVSQGGKRVGTVFTTTHQTSATQCTYTEYWYLLKGYKYVGGTASTTVTFTPATTKYADAEAFKAAMRATPGRLVVATVVEEGACTGSTILIDGSYSIAK